MNPEQLEHAPNRSAPDHLKEVFRYMLDSHQYTTVTRELNILIHT